MGLQLVDMPSLNAPALLPVVLPPGGWANIPLVDGVTQRPEEREHQRQKEETLAQWWADASEAWLDRAASPNTRRAYEGATKLFFKFCKPTRAWEVGGVHVITWQQAMRKKGLAETTINLRLAALSSFYSFCCYKWDVTDPETGRQVSLAKRNPVMSADRVKVSPYEKSIYLSADEVRALLRSIPRDSARGLRDYALVVSYIYTGRRSSEIRRLRWEDISQDGGRVYYAWMGKGSQRTDELPLPAYNAIVAYLEAAGRLETIEDEDFIFVALSDVAARLPNVKASSELRPLSTSFVNRIVKKCARRAGLKWEKIHTHTLRHTAAMLRRGLTNDIQELQLFLNHASLATTQIYVQHTEKRKDTLWAQVEALIGVE